MTRSFCPAQRARTIFRAVSMTMNGLAPSRRLNAARASVKLFGKMTASCAAWPCEDGGACSVRGCASELRPCEAELAVVSLAVVRGSSGLNGRAMELGALGSFSRQYERCCSSDCPCIELRCQQAKSAY